MKAFFAAIFVLIILAFAFTTIPQDLAARFKNYAGVDGFIKNRLAGVVAKRLFDGKNPQETRLELIEKIEDSLETLEKTLLENQANKPLKKSSAAAIAGAEKSAIELIEETRDTLEELKSRNGDEGLLKNTVEKIVSGVLHTRDVCVKEPGK